MVDIKIPEAINNFNVYKSGNVLIGIAGEIQLAEFSSMTETISGAGVLGEYETVIAGRFSNMDQEIPFKMLDEDIFTMANPLDVQEITLRASLQATIKSTGSIDFSGIRIVFRGRPKGFKPGVVKQGGQMGASVTLSLVYLLIEIDGNRKFEVDKLNNVFKINDVDILARIKQSC